MSTTSPKVAPCAPSVTHPSNLESTRVPLAGTLQVQFPNK